MIIIATTVSYNNSTIATVSNDTTVLQTSGKWLTDNITITDSGGGSTAIISDTTDTAGGTIRSITTTDEVYLQTKTITPTSSQQTVLPDSGYDGFSSIIVGASSGGGSSSSYTRTVVASEQTVTPTTTTSDGSTYYSAQLNLSSGLESGEEYIITYNGTEYFYTCAVLWGNTYLLGEINYFYGTIGLPYPFGIIWTSGNTCRMACGDSTAVTVKIEKLEFVGGSSIQTVTGTFTGSNGNTIQISCDFEPREIYIRGDLTGDVSLRGIVSFTLIKDRQLSITNDSSTSNTTENVWIIKPITGYNQANSSSEPYASYSNNTLTIDTVMNSSGARFPSGVTYDYTLVGWSGGTPSTDTWETLVNMQVTMIQGNLYYFRIDNYTEPIAVNDEYRITWGNVTHTFTPLLDTGSGDYYIGNPSITGGVDDGSGIPLILYKSDSTHLTGETTDSGTKNLKIERKVSSGGSTPSATAHTIYFEFSDGTDTTITAYYDDSFISNAITATTPTTYGQKTVTLAELDGVTWYEYDPSETWETLVNGNVAWIKDNDNDYPYCWISSLGNVSIPNGSVWRITYDNVEYRLTAVSGSIGNPKWGKGTDDGTNVPFIFNNPGWGAWTGSLNVPNVDSNYYFKIERLVTS